MYVYVVGWHPSVDSGANGGFEWRYSRHEAIAVLLDLTAQLLTGEPPERNLVFAKIRVPNHDDLGGDITDWLDRNLHLIELPLQEETITA